MPPMRAYRLHRAGRCGISPTMRMKIRRRSPRPAEFLSSWTLFDLTLATAVCKRCATHARAICLCPFPCFLTTAMASPWHTYRFLEFIRRGNWRRRGMSATCWRVCLVLACGVAGACLPCACKGRRARLDAEYRSGVCVGGSVASMRSARVHWMEQQDSAQTHQGGWSGTGPQGRVGGARSDGRVGRAKPAPPQTAASRVAV
jgi:hypothetical protein